MLLRGPNYFINHSSVSLLSEAFGVEYQILIPSSLSSDLISSDLFSPAPAMFMFVRKYPATLQDRSISSLKMSFVSDFWKNQISDLAVQQSIITTQKRSPLININLMGPSISSCIDPEGMFLSSLLDLSVMFFSQIPRKQGVRKYLFILSDSNNFLK